MDTTGLYWSTEVCGWVRSPGAADALATPWSGSEVGLPTAPPVRHLGEVVGWFPPLPGLPEQRRPAPEDVPQPT